MTSSVFSVFPTIVSLRTVNVQFMNVKTVKNWLEVLGTLQLESERLLGLNLKDKHVHYPLLITVSTQLTSRRSKVSLEHIKEYSVPVFERYPPYSLRKYKSECGGTLNTPFNIQDLKTCFILQVLPVQEQLKVLRQHQERKIEKGISKFYFVLLKVLEWSVPNKSQKSDEFPVMSPNPLTDKVSGIGVSIHYTLYGSLTQVSQWKTLGFPSFEDNVGHVPSQHPSGPVRRFPGRREGEKCSGTPHQLRADGGDTS